MKETAYNTPAAPGHPLAHHYGPQVHVLADAWSMSVLAQLGAPETGTTTFHRLLRAAYARLLHAVTAELTTTQVTIPTRMAPLSDGAAYTGAIIDPNQPVVIADIARAGIIPSDVFQQQLLDLLDDAVVRVDHLYMQRVTNDAGQVTGVDLAGSKIGGPVDDALLLIPDPMGATGGSIGHCVDYYRSTVPGTPRRIAACHLMVTPEYLRRMADDYPDVAVYTLRVDRGLSDPDVLSTALGQRLDERGLTDTQYIVPGAGGLGELLNNAFV